MPSGAMATEALGSSLPRGVGLPIKILEGHRYQLLVLTVLGPHGWRPSAWLGGTSSAQLGCGWWVVFLYQSPKLLDTVATVDL